MKLWNPLQTLRTFTLILPMIIATIPNSALGATGQDKSHLIVDMVAVVVKSKPSFSSKVESATSPSYNQTWSYGGGLLFGIPVFNSVPGPLDSFYKMFRALNTDLEIGALYFTREYPSSTDFAKNTSDAPRIGTKQSVMQFPALLRFGVPFGLSMGAGMYYGINNSSESGTNFSGHEIGGVASLKGYLGRRFGYRFLVDGRYTFTTSNATNTSVKTKFSDFQILFGVGI